MAYTNRENHMCYTLPTLEDAGVKIPPDLRGDRFCVGFEHALKGGQLSSAKCLRRSFRLGYRAAKLYPRQLHKQQGILSFPIQGRLKIRVI